MKSDKPYTPTYTETKPRSLAQRMTPLAWLIAALATLFVLGLAITLIGNMLKQSASQRPLSEVVTVPTALMPMPSPATTTVAVATATAFATAQPTGLPSTATPVPFTAPWASRMVKQADGTYMAPQEVVDAIKKMMKDWDAETVAAANLPITQTIERSKAADDKYYWPDERDKTLASLQQNGMYVRTAGTGQATDVKNFSADGLSAQVSQVSRGMVYDHYDTATLKLTQKGIKADDVVIIFNVRYNPDRKQWQVWNMDKFTALPKP